MRYYKGWKDYQGLFPGTGSPKSFFKRNFWFFLFLLAIGIGIQCLKVSLSTGSFKSEDSFESEANKTLGAWAKEDLREVLDPEVLCNSPGGKVDIHFSGRRYSVETTLDQRLQGYMLGQVKRSKSPLIGFVAMDPVTGRILSMVDSNKAEGAKNVCLSSRFPAASIFKIVSAAAAIDRCNISADTKLTYNGRANTLYKNQLTGRINRYTNRVSLKNSFAKSVNPVFGKLGIFRLKKGLLEEYAIRFGFNQWIDFELPVELSRISIGDDPYSWAEVACGFNRETLISPLHAAMMAAVIVNDGKLMEPTIVASIADTEKNPVYIGCANIIRQVISPKASQEMKELMAATISRGTCSSTFMGYRRDPILSKLSIGGKSGYINNKSDELHYDWFVGFCTEKTGARKLALAVLVVHDKLLRERARRIARGAMRYYFKTGEGQGALKT